MGRPCRTCGPAARPGAGPRTSRERRLPARPSPSARTSLALWGSAALAAATAGATSAKFSFARPLRTSRTYAARIWGRRVLPAMTARTASASPTTHKGMAYASLGPSRVQVSNCGPENGTSDTSAAVGRPADGHQVGRQQRDYRQQQAVGIPPSGTVAGDDLLHRLAEVVDRPESTGRLADAVGDLPKDRREGQVDRRRADGGRCRGRPPSRSGLRASVAPSSRGRRGHQRHPSRTDHFFRVPPVAAWSRSAATPCTCARSPVIAAARYLTSGLRPRPRRRRPLPAGGPGGPGSARKTQCR